jgi:hypothetical protein
MRQATENSQANHMRNMHQTTAHASDSVPDVLYKIQKNINGIL